MSKNKPRISGEFQEAVKMYLKAKEKIKKLNELVAKERKIMNSSEGFVLNYMASNDMTDRKLVVNEGKLSYGTSKTSESISKKYIMEKLTIYFQDEKKAEEVTNYLYDSRNTTEKNVLRLTKK